jgi:adenylate kinase
MGYYQLYRLYKRRYRQLKKKLRGIDCRKLLTREPIRVPGVPIYVIVGSPGSGKTTFGRQLAERHQGLLISTGDIYRRHVKTGSPEAEVLEKIKYDWRLLRNCVNHLIVNEILGAIASRPEVAQRSVIIDGLKGGGDLKLLDRNILGASWRVYHLKVPSVPVLVERILARREDRQDDTPEIAKRRVENYFKFYEPVIESELAELGWPVTVMESD